MPADAFNDALADAAHERHALDPKRVRTELRRGLAAESEVDFALVHAISAAVALTLA